MFSFQQIPFFIFTWGYRCKETSQVHLSSVSFSSGGFPLFKRMNDVQISLTLASQLENGNLPVMSLKGKNTQLSMSKVRIQCDKIIKR